MKPSPLICKNCEKPLLTTGDQALRHCSECYPAHSSPSCRKGFCSDAIPSLLRTRRNG